MTFRRHWGPSDARLAEWRRADCKELRFMQSSEGTPFRNIARMLPWSVEFLRG